MSSIVSFEVLYYKYNYMLRTFLNFFLFVIILLVILLQEQLSGIREKIYWFVAMFGPNDSHQVSSQRTSNQLAVDLSFGSIGYSLVLAKPFKRVNLCYITKMLLSIHAVVTLCVCVCV